MTEFSPAFRESWSRIGTKDFSEWDLQRIELEAPETGAILRHHPAAVSSSSSGRPSAMIVSLNHEIDHAVTAATRHGDYKPFIEILSKYAATNHKQASLAVGHAVGLVLGILHGMRGRVTALAQKVADLETKTISGGVRWAGIYAEGVTYRSGELCTRNGSLWLAQTDTKSKPGVGASDWRLIVKQGDVR